MSLLRGSRTYGSSELPGLDTEADGDVEAGGRRLVFVARRQPPVDLLGQNQRRLHLDHRTGPEMMTSPHRE